MCSLQYTKIILCGINIFSCIPSTAIERFVGDRRLFFSRYNFDSSTHTAINFDCEITKQCWTTEKNVDLKIFFRLSSLRSICFSFGAKQIWLFVQIKYSKWDQTRESSEKANVVCAHMFSLFRLFTVNTHIFRMCFELVCWVLFKLCVRVSLCVCVCIRPYSFLFFSLSLRWTFSLFISLFLYRLS